MVEAPEEIILSIAENSGMLEFHAQKKPEPASAELFDSVAPNPTGGLAESELVQEEINHPILAILQKQNRDYEGLFELSGMAPHDFAQILTELEIEGKVRKNSSGYYELA